MTDLEIILQKTYKSIRGKDLDDKQSHSILESLLSFRFIFDEIMEGPSIVYRDVFSSSASSKMIFPCDTIELRDILSSKYIDIHKDFVPVFSFGCGQTFFRKYPIFLLLDMSKIEGIRQDFGGISIFNGENLFIGSAILKIIVNQPSLVDVVQRVQSIVKEISPKSLEVSISNSVPGVTPSPSMLTKANNTPNIKTAEAIEIQLTPEEANLFNRLKSLRDTAGLTGKVEMRVAGGWVRDKLLGRPSKDIDIAISNMTGAEFAQRLGIGGAVIEANPEKSKNLETVKANVDGQEVDFVNLRSEQYTNTRIPTMQMGTPEEDAKRRDFTINAMFFNLETGQIEDFVGGKKDLQNMYLRTPLDPFQTFMDDPLRMLRLLRFHSRYEGSTVDPKILEAMKDPRIQESYKLKVSPERAGPELMGMMKGSDPSSALRLLLDTDLYKSVFKVPGMDKTLGLKIDQQNEHHKLDLMNHTLSVVDNLNKIMKENGENDNTRALMNFAALFHDFGKMHPEGRQPHPTKPNQMQYLKHEDVSAQLADEILKSIGVGENERKFVNRVVSMHMRPHTDSWTPKSMGKFIRDSIIPGQESNDNIWKYVLYHGMADSMSKGSDDWHDDVNLKKQHMEGFQNYITNRQQMPVNIQKPLLNGTEIMALIPELKPDTGFIRVINDMLLSEQDAGTLQTKEQAQQKVLEWKQNNLQSYMSMPKNQQSQPQQNNKGNIASNWFAKVKTAVDNDIYKGTWIEDRWDDVVYRQYEKPISNPNPKPNIEKLPSGETLVHDSVQVPFRVGDRVRNRHKGIAAEQQFGKITDIKLDKDGYHVYVIKWENVKDPQTIRLNNTLEIASLLARA